MKRFIFGFLAIFFLIFNILPSVYLFADGGYSNTQYAQVGSLLFSNLITSGEATELDFSDYTGDGTDLLIALGEMAVSGDVTGLVEYGLDWLGGQIDDAYESAIDSIREWEWRIAPDLYNWWYNGSQYEFKLEPVKNSGRALRRLLTPPDDELPTPDPDINYLSYINLMNGNSGSGNDFFWMNAPEYPAVDANGYNYISFKPITKSFINYNWATSGIINRTWWSNAAYVSDIINIYIISDSSSSYFSLNITPYNNVMYENPNGLFSTVGFRVNNGWNYRTNNAVNVQPFTFTHSESNLNSLFSWLSGKVRNVNIYVNGLAWAIVGNPSYPISIDDTLTVLNDEPAIYNYPDNTYIDLNDLQTIITNAIDDSDVLTYNDIKPVFVDINGQEAVAVVQIYRNDYDNMYPEQFPLIILPDDEYYFSTHLLDTSKSYIDSQVDVVENTVDVLPSPIVGVLAIGCILTIFACIIHRLLE